MNGDTLNITSTVDFEATPSGVIDIDATRLTVREDASVPQAIQLTARYEELGVQIEAYATLNVIAAAP